MKEKLLFLSNNVCSKFIVLYIGPTSDYKHFNFPTSLSLLSIALSTGSSFFAPQRIGLRIGILGMGSHKFVKSENQNVISSGLYNLHLTSIIS